MDRTRRTFTPEFKLQMVRLFDYFVCQNKLDNFSSSMKLMNTSNGVL